MHRAFSKFRNLFRNNTPKQPARRKPVRRLYLESLEDRLAPAAAFTANLSGVAYVGATNATPAFVLTGVVLNLNGTTVTGTTVNQSTSTDTSGNYSFQNILPGTYSLSYGQAAGYLGGPGIFSGITVTGGQNTSDNIAFAGLNPNVVSGRMFLSDTTASDFPMMSAGFGANLVNYRADSAPFLASQIPQVNGYQNQTLQVDLPQYFTDPNASNTLVQINTAEGDFDISLLDSEAPDTVANFLDYVESGDYNNSIFHRLVSGFVLQGGGFALGTGSTTTLDTITALPSVDNEFSSLPASSSGQNVAGTIAMALSGVQGGIQNPNSGNDEFYINLGDNSTSLDSQDFTVFGNIVGGVNSQVFTNLTSSSASPPVNVTNEVIPNATGFQSPLPLIGGPTGSTSTSFEADDPAFPGDASASNFEEITSASVVSQSDQLT